MGMFDYISCKYPLELPNAPSELRGVDLNEIEYQTKDLDCVLEHYEVRSDGTLWVTRPDSLQWKHLEGYIGSIRFYDCYMLDDAPHDYWIEWIAIFVYGKVARISLVELREIDSGTRKSIRVEREAAESKENALQSKWYMKYGYSYYDKVVAWVFKKIRYVNTYTPSLRDVENWLRPL